MTVCYFSVFRDEDTTLTIHQGENAEGQYLTLPELGKMLQELRRALPGMCACVHSLHEFYVVEGTLDISDMLL